MLTANDIEYFQCKKNSMIEAIIEMYDKGEIDLSTLVCPSKEELASMTPEEREIELQAFRAGFYTPQRVRQRLQHFFEKIDFQLLEQMYQGYMQMAKGQRLKSETSLKVCTKRRKLPGNCRLTLVK
jgi:hypothetical protein